MKKKPVEEMTSEELEMRRKSHNRLFYLLVLVTLFLIGYLIYEMVVAFTR